MKQKKNAKLEKNAGEASEAEEEPRIWRMALMMGREGRGVRREASDERNREQAGEQALAGDDWGGQDGGGWDHGMQDCPPHWGGGWFTSSRDRASRIGPI